MANMRRMLSEMPPLELLVCFEAVARFGSFTGAARELSITQSAVSKQIKSLEEALACSLFDRHAKGIKLSSAGTSLLEEIGPPLYRLHQAIVKAKHATQGQAVSVACTLGVAQYWLFPRIVRFNQLYPHITVDVVSSNSNNEHACNECDVGILYGTGDWATLDSVRLIDEVIYPVCSSELDLRVPSTPADLCTLPLIQLDSRQWDCIDWQDWFHHFGVEYQIPRNAITFNQITLSLNAAMEGLGVSLAWDSMAHHAVEAGTLKKLGEFEYVTGRGDYLVSTKHRPLSEPASRFRDWIVSSV
ncbi:LysR family transcriptional regulator [Burkholderia cenocepacia]|nr:LysR family transcriptional regulator [Burkholderia cenocepacia]